MDADQYLHLINEWCVVWDPIAADPHKGNISFTSIDGVLEYPINNDYFLDNQLLNVSTGEFTTIAPLGNVMNTIMNGYDLDELEANLITLGYTITREYEKFKISVL